MYDTQVFMAPGQVTVRVSMNEWFTCTWFAWFW